MWFSVSPAFRSRFFQVVQRAQRRNVGPNSDPTLTEQVKVRIASIRLPLCAPRPLRFVLFRNPGGSLALPETEMETPRTRLRMTLDISRMTPERVACRVKLAASLCLLCSPWFRCCLWESVQSVDESEIRPECTPSRGPRLSICQVVPNRAT